MEIFVKTSRWTLPTAKRAAALQGFVPTPPPPPRPKICHPPPPPRPLLFSFTNAI